MARTAVLFVVVAATLFASAQAISYCAICVRERRGARAMAPHKFPPTPSRGAPSAFYLLLLRLDRRLLTSSHK